MINIVGLDCLCNDVIRYLKLGLLEILVRPLQYVEDGGLGCGNQIQFHRP